jgi:hypothetical protein
MSTQVPAATGERIVRAVAAVERGQEAEAHALLTGLPIRDIFAVAARLWPEHLSAEHGVLADITLHPAFGMWKELVAGMASIGERRD